MRYKQGDIILIPFPYTDLSATKKRPVVVISKDSINHNNYIVVKITSTIRKDQFTFEIEPNEANNVLHYRSEARTNEVFTVHKSLVIKRLTTISKDCLKRLSEKVKNNIEVK